MNINIDVDLTWSNNKFVGGPPRGFNSWSEWADYVEDTGTISGVIIKAIYPEGESE